MMDRKEPTVREHTTDVADREAIVVHVERMGLLKVEDEVGQVHEDAMTENLTSFPLLAHTGGCAIRWGRMS